MEKTEMLEYIDHTLWLGLVHLAASCIAYKLLFVTVIEP